MPIRTKHVYFMTQRPDSAISQVNPVSGTWYPVLALTSLCTIRQACAYITWAVTQPTPIQIRITIDGIPVTHSFVNPASGTAYSLIFNVPYDQEAAQNLVAAPISLPFWYKGRSIQVDARITWAVTQPTPLVARVKYSVKS